jgi:hypothetical protein
LASQTRPVQSVREDRIIEEGRVLLPDFVFLARTRPALRMAVASGPDIRKTYLVDPLILVWLESRLIDGNVLVDIDDLIRGKGRHD